MFIMQCIDSETNRIILGTGAGYQVIFNDLKTLNGVLKRISKYNINLGKPFIVCRGKDIYNLSIVYTSNGGKTI